jgi:AbrB family looped-hinge helix DNA binding protein
MMCLISVNYVNSRKSVSTMKNASESTHIYGTAKVGERGQIVIPSRARREFGIRQGDILLVVAGPRKRGIGLIKADSVRDFVERIMKGLEETEDAGK